MPIGPDKEDDLYMIDSGIHETPPVVPEKGEASTKKLSVVHVGKIKDVVAALQAGTIPENHIVHEIPGNISANMKFLLFSWEEKNPGWIKETFLSEKKKIRFYGDEVRISGVPVVRGVPVEASRMPPANAMPGNTFEEKRKNLDLLLKTFNQ